MLKILIGTNEGKVLCISNNEDEIKASMVNYLIDTDQEPTEDFFESRNWGEYDIEVYEYHQPQLNENQQEMLQEVIKQYDNTKPKTVLHALEHLSMIAYLLDEMEEVTEEDCIVVAQAFLDWAQEQEGE